MALSVRVNLDAGKPVNNDPAILKPESFIPLSRRLGYYLSPVLVRLPLTRRRFDLATFLANISKATDPGKLTGQSRRR